MKFSLLPTDGRLWVGRMVMLESQPGVGRGGSNDDAATVMLGSKSPPEEGWRQRLAASVLIKSDSSAKCRVPLQRWREVGVRQFDLGGVTCEPWTLFSGCPGTSEILSEYVPYWVCVLRKRSVQELPLKHKYEYLHL